jgi:hypothetical protein
MRSGKNSQKGDLFRMTIDLRSVPPVAGESAVKIRDILRRSHGAFREDWLSDRFQCDERRAHELAQAMEAAGYLRRDRERELRNNSPFPWYSLTDGGEGITRASAVSRINRKTAEAALVDFMKSVQTVNASSKYLYSIERVAVFGSFLGPRKSLGDVDVAVHLNRSHCCSAMHRSKSPKRATLPS